LLFAAATPVSKLLLSESTPVLLAGLLYIGAALGVLPVVFIERRRGTSKTYDKTSRWRLIGAILCGGVLGPIAYLFGLKLAAASSVSLWLNLELAATALLGHFVFRDYLGRYGWMGVAGVVAAGALLSVGDQASPFAALLVAAACVLWGIDNHLTALIDGITPAQSTLWKGFAAGAFNISLALLLGSSWPGAGTVAVALLVGALSYGASIALYISSAQQLGATRAQIIFATSPFLAAALSALILSERLGAFHAVAVAALGVSVFLILRDRQVHEHAHSHATVEHDHSHGHDDGHHTHVHEGLPASTRHSHWHRHEPLTHRHPHWPDLHHRHEH
jgi:drug/metabolite transporter (DMT)-like permease